MLGGLFWRKARFGVMEGSHPLCCRRGDFLEEVKPASSPLGPVTHESLLWSFNVGSVIDSCSCN